MSKKSIYLSLCLFSLICIIYAGSIVRAHTPSNMSLTYSTNTNELSVTITHNVGSDPSHYIDTVIIMVNGSIVDTHVYTSQPNPSMFTYIYNATANIGAIIFVRAECSISGFREQSLTVTAGTTTTNEIIPGFIGFLIPTSISIILITIFISKRKK
ncbi:MAG: hypothetical protein ACFFFB_00855 [Candidatus Heimdallarchaeota archaeon]